MRAGEALALKWSDLDFNVRFIEVQRGLTKWGIEKPKSVKNRRVDMSKQLAEALLDLRHERKEETLKKGWKEMPEWIFVNEEGKLMDEGNWRKRIFNKALEKAGLRQVRVHNLRHSYAIALIQAGEPLPYIQRQLGHHSIKVTVDIYGKYMPTEKKEAVDKLDDISAPIRTPGATGNKKGLEQNC